MGEQSPAVISQRLPEPYSNEGSGYDFMSGANITVMGVPREAGGLKESLAKFTRHQTDVADALLNVSEGIEKDDPRPPYQHQEWPKMVYHPDGEFKVVANPQQELELKAKGFRREPYLVPKVALEDPRVEKQRLIDENRLLSGKLTVQNEQLTKLADRLEALEAKRK